MDLSLSLATVAALFASMAVLAAMPSVSVLAVTARAASGGFRHGALTSLGVVAGDLVFIALAIFGLAMLAEAMGEAFVLVRYAGGLYLLWLGVVVWRAAGRSAAGTSAAAGSGWSSFMTGLLITLADQKAVLFYLGFFPAFLDLSEMSVSDAAMIGLIALFAVGGVKLIYAWAAHRAGAWLGRGAGLWMNRIASVVMVGAGIVVLLRR
ncbi:MAG: LysE family translocator [Pseudomonadota bacterium]|nr:LysE family translocator [Pseudomonadota bacterium]